MTVSNYFILQFIGYLDSWADDSLSKIAWHHLLFGHCLSYWLSVLLDTAVLCGWFLSIILPERGIGSPNIIRNSYSEFSTLSFRIPRTVQVLSFLLISRQIYPHSQSSHHLEYIMPLEAHIAFDPSDNSLILLRPICWQTNLRSLSLQNWNSFLL